MANVTVLTSTPDGTLTIVCHYATPAGNNAVGVSWSTALVGAGFNTTILTTGNGPGQISAADLASIQAGTLREVVTQFNVLGISTMTPAQQQAAVAALYNQVVADDQARFATVLKYFGYTQ